MVKIKWDIFCDENEGMSPIQIYIKIKTSGKSKVFTSVHSISEGV